MAIKMSTRQKIITLKKVLSIFTPGLSSRSIISSVVSTKIRKNGAAVVVPDNLFD